MNPRSACVVALAIALAFAGVPGFGTGRAVAAGEVRVTAQLLSIEGGFVFLANGEAFKVAPGVTPVDEKGVPLKSMPRLGAFVRLTFDPAGIVTGIEVGVVPFAPESQLGVVEQYSVVAPLARATGPTRMQLRNERVDVAFTVQVPTTTLSTDNVYMETNETSWNPLAVRFDRIDAQHFRAVLSVPVGSAFSYLFTRGSSQSIERSSTGMQRTPRTLIVRDFQSHAVFDKVAHWGDEAGNGVIANPQSSPTPFNPAPYPNLPPVKINPAARH